MINKKKLPLSPYRSDPSLSITLRQWPLTADNEWRVSFLKHYITYEAEEGEEDGRRGRTMGRRGRGRRRMGERER